MPLVPQVCRDPDYYYIVLPKGNMLVVQSASDPLMMIDFYGTIVQKECLNVGTVGVLSSPPTSRLEMFEY